MAKKKKYREMFYSSGVPSRVIFRELVDEMIESYTPNMIVTCDDSYKYWLTADTSRATSVGNSIVYWQSKDEERIKGSLRGTSFSVRPAGFKKVVLANPQIWKSRQYSLFYLGDPPVYARGNAAPNSAYIPCTDVYRVKDEDGWRFCGKEEAAGFAKKQRMNWQLSPEVMNKFLNVHIVVDDAERDGLKLWLDSNGITSANIGLYIARYWLNDNSITECCDGSAWAPAFTRWKEATEKIVSRMRMKFRSMKTAL